MAFDTPENREILIRSHPALETDPYFYVSSDKTLEYNCIAWAMGFNDRWVDHLPDYDKAVKKWWPAGVPRGFHPDCLIQAFQAVGFELCHDDKYEEGYEKIVIYYLQPFIIPRYGIYESIGWTHAAKVLTEKTYHSKMGDKFDIYHSSGNLFVGSSYGAIYAYMRRPLVNRRIIEVIIAQEQKYVIPANIDDIVASKLNS